MMRDRKVGSYAPGWVLVSLAVVTALVAAALLVGPATTLFSSLAGAPVCPTPCAENLRFRAGTYVVFEQVGTTIGGGGFSYTRTHDTTITPADVHVTAADGTALEVTAMPSTSSQTLDRDGGIFAGVARLRVPREGHYAVTVSAPSATAVVVAADIGQTFLRAIPGVAVGVVAGLLGSAGLIVLVVAWARRRRADAAGGPAQPIAG